ncbi:hypothetical protein K9U40_19360 [Xanthobacter autotrophicus]|uniref:hypothetical protein n=1 Tax=Xanthobacter TaxID=279 RepID=UPI0024ABAA0A|nr:hypothetical protein [Xanthobacter autotrophicus]MDI4666465.1 hypothetical protein [Xanthobacter autotrophicus]
MLGDGQKRVIYRGKMLFSQGTPHPAFMLKADAEVAAKGGGKVMSFGDTLEVATAGRGRSSSPPRAIRRSASRAASSP